MTIEIYQLKITAKYIKPSIWRTVLVPSNITFLELHEIIMELFGFDNSHLFAFMPSKNYSDQISNDIYSGHNNAHKIRLSKVFESMEKIDYTYDFGDDWQFTVKLDKTIARDKNLSYPQCIKYKGGMMLEDCGGAYCYQVITNWCRNKTKENAQKLIQLYGDEEVLQWYAEFDPDAFDLNSIKF